MITAQALAVCIFAAAQTYAVPPSVLLGIINVEGGRIGQAVKNSNNTYDLGPMQINTIWIPELARYWGISTAKATSEVRDNPCINIGVGAWILRSKINQTGSLKKGIAYYHSGTPKLGLRYRKKVMTAMKRYNLIQHPNDLLTGTNSSSSSVVPASSVVSVRHPG